MFAANPFGWAYPAQAYAGRTSASVTGAANLTGSGTSSASGIRLRTGAVVLAGTGTSSSAGSHTALAAASLSGNGSITSNGSRTRFGAVALSGIGAPTAGGYQTARAAATLAGAGTLGAAGQTASVAAAELLGNGTLAADGNAATPIPGCHILAEDGSGAILDEDGNYILQEECITAVTGPALSGEAWYTNIQQFRLQVADTHLQGHGRLQATGVVTRLGTIALSGVGYLHGSGVTTRLGAVNTVNATLTGRGHLFVDNAIKTPAGRVGLSAAQRERELRVLLADLSHWEIADDTYLIPA